MLLLLLSFTAKNRNEPISMVYVPSHLYHMLFELFKVRFCPQAHIVNDFTVNCVGKVHNNSTVSQLVLLTLPVERYESHH